MIDRKLFVKTTSIQIMRLQQRCLSYWNNVSDRQPNFITFFFFGLEGTNEIKILYKPMRYSC